MTPAQLDEAIAQFIEPKPAPPAGHEILIDPQAHGTTGVWYAVCNYENGDRVEVCAKDMTSPEMTVLLLNRLAQFAVDLKIGLYGRDDYGDALPPLIEVSWNDWQTHDSTRACIIIVAATLGEAVANLFVTVNNLC